MRHKIGNIFITCLYVLLVVICWCAVDPLLAHFHTFDDRWEDKFFIAVVLAALIEWCVVSAYRILRHLKKA